MSTRENYSPQTLLLGGGYTLTHLAKMLPPNSFVITTTSREKAEKFTQNGWISKVLDTRDSNSLNALFETYPTLKAVIDSVPPFENENENLLGVQNLSRTLNAFNIKKLIYLSTTGVYGVEDGSWVDEESPLNATNRRAVARIESENIYKGAISELSIFRIAAIYGPGRGLYQSLKDQRYKLIAGMDRWSNRIHVEDLASTLRAASEALITRAIPKVICCADDAPALNSEVIKFYCEKFSLPFPSEISRDDAAKRQLHSLLSNQRVSNKLLKSSLLPSLRYPSYREGAISEEN